jgi:hypothetical protein
MATKGAELVVGSKPSFRPDLSPLEDQVPHRDHQAGEEHVGDEAADDRDRRLLHLRAGAEAAAGYGAGQPR